MTYEQLKNTKNGYWDSTANDWVNLATTRKAYYKMHSTSTEWTLYANAATTTSAFKAYINEIIAGTLDPYDYKLVFSSKTNHFTIFAVIMPFIAVPVEAAPEPDPDPPAPPGGGGGGGGYTTYCSSVSYGDWGECANDKQSREVASKSPTS